MLDRRRPFGTVGGVHEHGAAYEQGGRLFDANYFEIDPRTGQRLEGPGTAGYVEPKGKANPAPAPQPATSGALQAIMDQLGVSTPEEAMAAIKAMNTPADPPAPVGLSLQSLKNPPPPEIEAQSGQDDGNEQPQDAAASNDIVLDGINLSAWARGELPGIEFKKVQPIIAEHFKKKPVNTTQALAIVKAGLPQE